MHAQTPNNWASAKHPFGESSLFGLAQTKPYKIMVKKKKERKISFMHRFWLWSGWYRFLVSVHPYCVVQSVVLQQLNCNLITFQKSLLASRILWTQKLKRANHIPKKIPPRVILKRNGLQRKQGKKNGRRRWRGDEKVSGKVKYIPVFFPDMLTESRVSIRYCSTFQH